jgi:ABC-type sugar transport system permease subunit
MIPGLALPGVISTLFYLFFHGKTGALNQYIIMPLGFDPVNWMMDPDFIMPSLIMQSVWRWTGLVTLFFICGLEAIPRWQFEAAKIEGVDGLQKIRQVLIPNLYHLAVFATVFLVVDGFASFSGAYNLLGGSGGIMDAGLLLVTYVYQVAFPGGSGQFDFPGAAAMSLLVVPVTALLLFLVLQNRRRLLLR